MNKYRLHTMSQLNETKHNFDILAKSHENHNCVKIITAQSEKIKEMAAVMQAVLQKEDMQVDQINQIMTGLQTENAGLRELLGITTKMDNYLTFTENSTQTDELENKEPMNEDKMEN